MKCPWEEPFEVIEYEGSVWWVQDNLGKVVGQYRSKTDANYFRDLLNKDWKERKGKERKGKKMSERDNTPVEVGTFDPDDSYTIPRWLYLQIREHGVDDYLREHPRPSAKEIAMILVEKLAVTSSSQFASETYSGNSVFMEQQYIDSAVHILTDALKKIGL